MLTSERELSRTGRSLFVALPTYGRRPKATLPYGSLLLQLSVALGSSGCSFRRTQTVIEIHADSHVVSEVDEVRIEVRDQNNNAIFSRSIFPKAMEFGGFPLEVPI